jgi:purine catabolism regulator
MITVNALSRDESFGLRFLAGRGGGSRVVTWAHVVDLPDPWRWVTAGNLVMTTAGGMPADPARQADWVSRLAEAGISALVVAPRADAPPISPRMLEEAETRNLPLLLASFDLEFAKLARRVIESALRTQRDRLDASQRLFQSYAAALREGTTLQARLEALGRRQGWQLRLEDTATGEALAATGALPAGRPRPGAVKIPGGARSALRVWRAREDEAPVDGALLHYLAGLLGVEEERWMIERDARRAEGETLLRDLLSGATDLGAARAILAQRGLRGPLVCLALAPEGSAAWGPKAFHHAPEFREVFPLIHADGPLIVVLPDREELIRAAGRLVGDATRLGVGGPVTAATDVAESGRQARLALAQARDAGLSLVRYGSAEIAGTLTPRSLAEARGLVARYLGPLIDHDRKNDIALVRTLATFLANDRNWKATAAQLGIHRQTLVYRLRVIERLTGLRVGSTSGTAAFWLALEAGRASGLLPD